MTRETTYSIAEIEPYINWLYFFHAWQMGDKPLQARERLKMEAEEMLSELDGHYQTHARFIIAEANSDGDDIIIDGSARLPMLRQQALHDTTGHQLCLADFIRPLSSGQTDHIGLFATTVDAGMTADHQHDPYALMMAATLADRLAEATAEKMHEHVRKYEWGYAPDEHLTMEQLHREEYQGIRPAVGYPSMPDLSLNFILADLLDMPAIGIRLTENGMMTPHASVSGLMMAHPAARYFAVGKIGSDQLADYARRRGLPIQLMRKFLSSSLVND